MAFENIKEDGTVQYYDEFGHDGWYTPKKWLAMDAGDNVLARGTDFHALEKRYQHGVREGRIHIVPAD